MVAIFLDGESKSGKTAVARHVKQVLQAPGWSVRLVVGGYFFRTVTHLTLQREFDRNSDESLRAAVQAVLASAELLDEINEAALHTPEIDEWVSRIAQFDFVQATAQDWRERSAQKALDDNIDVLLLDGRNLRAKLDDWLQRTQVAVALELIIFCRPEIAARRYLSDAGNLSPSEAELQDATTMISERRDMDRQRAEAAYQAANDPVILRPGEVSASDALHAAFEPTVISPPRPILFDNSDVPLADGLTTVEALATSAVENLK